MTDVIDTPTTSPISTSRHADVLIVTSNNPPVNALGHAHPPLVAALTRQRNPERASALRPTAISRVNPPPLRHGTTS